MSTRTLEERIQARWLNRGDEKLFVHVHVRAELDRLARQVRKLDHRSEVIWRKEVLALIKEAKQ